MGSSGPLACSTSWTLDLAREPRQRPVGASSDSRVLPADQTRAWIGDPMDFEEFCDRASEPQAILNLKIPLWPRIMQHV